MAGLRTLDGLDVAGKRIVVRADLNVPMKGGVVADDTRIRCLVPTLNELADKGASVVVLSHFGRPDGKPVAECSLAPLRVPLEALAGRPVRFVSTDWMDSVHLPRFGRSGEIILGSVPRPG